LERGIQLIPDGDDRVLVYLPRRRRIHSAAPSAASPVASNVKLTRFWTGIITLA